MLHQPISGVCQSPQTGATIRAAQLNEICLRYVCQCTFMGTAVAESWQVLLQTCFMNECAEGSCAQRPDDTPLADASLLYFRYLCGAHQKEQDTCLAKVLGLYQVCLLSTASSYPLLLYQILIPNKTKTKQKNQIKNIKKCQVRKNFCFRV